MTQLIIYLLTLASVGTVAILDFLQDLKNKNKTDTHNSKKHKGD